MARFNLLRKLDILLGRFCSIASILSKQKITQTTNYKKILLIKLWGLGNLTVIWPLINRIKEKYPQSQILFLTFETNREFLERNKNIDRIICLKITRNIFKIMTLFLSLLRKLNKEKVDLVINFETFNNAAALFSYLIGAQERIGLHNKYEKLFYTNCQS